MKNTRRRKKKKATSKLRGLLTPFHLCRLQFCSWLDVEHKMGS